ncbi:MAG TPA: hypothetical protein VEY12_02670 [Thermoplasmata archaeon]|nr:hypothetical protein [Thermoplasmata archaeon]
MKVRPGWILGIVGGLITIVGAVLPWATVSGGSLAAPLTFSGATVGLGGIAVLLFGVLGLICVAIPNRITAILGLVWGILALLLALLTLVGLAAIAALAAGSGTGVTVTTQYGAYLALVGTLVLIVGSAIAYTEAKKAAAPPMMPPPVAPPMAPPPS